MAKVVLSDREVGLIKGLIQHKALNDQQVLAIFSFLDRNFNHREIGAIRKGTKPCYVAIAAATVGEVDALLYHYAKLAALAEHLGFYATTYTGAQVRKAVEIFKTAVLVYNNNTLSTRSETFIVLTIIAWTYVLHARLTEQGVTPAFKNADGSPVMIDGQEKLWELGYCIERPQSGLSVGEMANLRYLIAIRNAIEHRSAEDVNDALQAKIQANALNFLRFVKDNFGSKYDFSHDPAYSFRVYVVPKVTNNAKKADQAVIYSPVGSNVEVAIKHVERPKYRMTEAIKKLLDDDGVAVTAYQFTQAWKLNDLKDPAKGFAVLLGGQWFWYREGIDRIRGIVTT